MGLAVGTKPIITGMGQLLPVRRCKGNLEFLPGLLCLEPGVQVDAQETP